MNEKYIWAGAALFLGFILAKNAQAEASATPKAHNTIATSGDWWSFAGMWNAG
jgi:hypothetical protein